MEVYSDEFTFFLFKQLKLGHFVFQQKSAARVVV